MAASRLNIESNWENAGQGVVIAAAQMTGDIALPVAITVFPDEIYRVPETWARRAYRNLIYFHEVNTNEIVDSISSL